MSKIAPKRQRSAIRRTREPALTPTAVLVLGRIWLFITGALSVAEPLAIAATACNRAGSTPTAG
jgi:hypothetical protein